MAQRTDGKTRHEHPAEALRSVLTLTSPLGPSYSEPLVDDTDVFRELYDETNHIHVAVRGEDPSYIVGRKGAGKTTFLIGGALAAGVDVTLVKSEDIWSEVNKLRMRYAERNGPVVADTLVHAWEVLLFHAALLEIATSERLSRSNEHRRIWAYISSYGDPPDIEQDHLLASVAGKMTKALIEAPLEYSFREACWSIETDRGSFAAAADAARKVLGGAETADRPGLYVVCDNLEDLHKYIDDFSEVITALFRVPTRAATRRKDQALPFRCRFAFPAELLPRLRVLAANAEKDFSEYLTIRWRAGELLVLAGNRLRTFLDLQFPDAAASLGLPREHDPADREAATQTLRAILPAEIVNGYGCPEDPLAYVLRHTQVLPRHLIQMLNDVISRAVKGLATDGVPQVTPADVVAGVRDAEKTIVESLLTSYSYDRPEIGAALGMIKNHVKVTSTVSEMHRAFNDASVARSGLGFDDFVDACIAIGALGIVSLDEETARYEVGKYAYTYTTDLRTVEAQDRVCLHPLFMHHWFDRPVIDRMGKSERKAIYPYGSDPAHEVEV